MPTATVNPISIARLIQSDADASGALLTLLQTEQEALKSRKHQNLEQLVRDKNTHIQTLEANTAKRHQLLTQSGREATVKSWESLLEACADENLQHLWQTVKANFDECRRLNEINGKMIVRGQQTVKRLLNILRGQTGAPGLYTESGATQGQNTGGYTIVEA
ncbi:MAG: flagellar protein FlgN [Exilibacterium sp.]